MFQNHCVKSATAMIPAPGLLRKIVEKRELRHLVLLLAAMTAPPLTSGQKCKHNCREERKGGSEGGYWRLEGRRW